MSDLQKLMPLLVSMRALIDATLLELATESRIQPKASKGFLLSDEEKAKCKHVLVPGMGEKGLCQICGEMVERGSCDE